LIEGDPIIQIGTVFHRYGEKEPYLRHILVIGPEENMKKEDICDSMEDINITVQQCFTEKELLLEWSKIIKKEDPEFITGYNIFGFDFRYIQDRVSELFIHNKKCHYKWGCNHKCEFNQFYNMGKINSTKYEAGFHSNKKCSSKYQKLASSALGENDLNYIMMDGRILFDIQKEVQKGHNLESYKLDNVASHFMRGKIKEINDLIIITDNIGHLKDGDYISFRLHSNIGEELYNNGKKIKIIKIEGKKIKLSDRLEIDLSKYKVEWCLNKDDISPQDIFDKHKQIKGGSKARAEVAKYCIQDCELCINLLLLLDIIPNNLAMANVSYVPASYIFLRGQGVKVTSVVSRMCSLRNTRMPDLKNHLLRKNILKGFEMGVRKKKLLKK
jgi:DNA polymerase elongation subunit (family B)